MQNETRCTRKREQPVHKTSITNSCPFVLQLLICKSAAIVVTEAPLAALDHVYENNEAKSPASKTLCPTDTGVTLHRYSKVEPST
jgi:hypothetical protein